MTSANDARNLIITSIQAKIRELETEVKERSIENGEMIYGIEKAGNEIKSAREDIDSLQRFVADRVKDIEFRNTQIENNNWFNDEAEKLIAGLKEELATYDTPNVPETPAESPAPARRVRTQYGELTPEQMKVIRKKYAVLLELRGASLYEYLEFLKSKGRTETNKAISLSLGKNPNWLSNMTLIARKAGYDA